MRQMMTAGPDLLAPRTRSGRVRDRYSAASSHHWAC